MPAGLDVIDRVSHDRSIELQIEEVTVAKEGFGEGATLPDWGIREDGSRVSAVKTAGDETRLSPTADVRIQAGDRLVLMGQSTRLREWEWRLQKQ